MEIKYITIQENEFSIPAILIVPAASCGAVLAVHGYGGNKEEMLGLSLRVAEAGFTVCVIDQLGHGENKQPLSNNVLQETEAAVAFCRTYGMVAAIGHSSGGRFIMHGSADFIIGISPALAANYGPKTHEVLDFTRSYRVTEQYPGVNYDILQELPAWEPRESQALILYGSRDVPEIIAACRQQEEYTKVVEVEHAMHGDIFMLEETAAIVTAQLKNWFEEA